MAKSARENLVRQCFALSPQQIKWLDQHSDKTGMAKSEIVRRAVESFKYKIGRGK